MRNPLSLKSFETRLLPITALLLLVIAVGAQSAAADITLSESSGRLVLRDDGHGDEGVLITMEENAGRPSVTIRERDPNYPESLNSAYPIHNRVPYSRCVGTGEFRPAIGLRCNLNGITGVTAELANGDDRATVETIGSPINPLFRGVPVELNGGDGRDVLNCEHSALACRINGGPGYNRIVGSEFADVLINGDRIDGNGGNDSIEGGNATGQIDGGAGDDRIDPGYGEDYVEGGSGSDTVTYERRDSGVKVDIASATHADDGAYRLIDGEPASTEHDNIQRDVENVIGSNGDDFLEGSSGPNALHGMAGDDYLNGHAGNDYVTGWLGSDIVVDDEQPLDPAATDSDLYEGGPGADWISYANESDPITVDLSDTGRTDGVSREADSVGDDFENVIGGQGNDTLIGNAAANRLDGSEGNDTLNGLTGSDVMIGDVGTDTVTYADRTANVRADLTGSNRNDGQSRENDSISATVENLTGGSGNDHLIGNDGLRNQIVGGLGNDFIEVAESGKQVADRVFCGEGEDSFVVDERDRTFDCENEGAPVSPISPLKQIDPAVQKKDEPQNPPPLPHPNGPEISPTVTHPVEKKPAIEPAEQPKPYEAIKDVKKLSYSK